VRPTHCRPDRDRRQDRDPARSDTQQKPSRWVRRPPPGSQLTRLSSMRGRIGENAPSRGQVREFHFTLPTELCKAVGYLRAGKRPFFSSLLVRKDSGGTFVDSFEAAARNATAVAGVSLPREANGTPHTAPALWFSVSSQRAGAPKPKWRPAGPQSERASVANMPRGML
jgi:hypothetical protein